MFAGGNVMLIENPQEYVPVSVLTITVMTYSRQLDMGVDVGFHSHADTKTFVHSQRTLTFQHNNKRLPPP